MRVARNLWNPALTCFNPAVAVFKLHAADDLQSSVFAIFTSHLTCTLPNPALLISVLHKAIRVVLEGIITLFSHAVVH